MLRSSGPFYVHTAHADRHSLPFYTRRTDSRYCTLTLFRESDRLTPYAVYSSFCGLGFAPLYRGHTYTSMYCRWIALRA